MVLARAESIIKFRCNDLAFKTLKRSLENNNQMGETGLQSNIVLANHIHRRINKKNRFKRKTNYFSPNK
jgi:hypothetical protein